MRRDVFYVIRSTVLMAAVALTWPTLMSWGTVWILGIAGIFRAFQGDWSLLQTFAILHLGFLPIGAVCGVLVAVEDLRIGAEI
jgi:hypothetical protein